MPRERKNPKKLRAIIKSVKLQFIKSPELFLGQGQGKPA